MNITTFPSILALLLLASAQTNAALITQVFEFDDLRSFEVDGLSADGRFEYFFEPFDSSLGTLTDVSIVARATSNAELEQFQCSATNVSCTVEFPLNLLLFLEPGEFEQVEAGNFTTNQTGVHLGGIANISFPSISAYAPFGWEIDDFYTTPLHYLAAYEWRCVDCSSIDDPLMVTVQGSATLTYEYTPSAVSAPSTLTLFALGLVTLRRRAVLPCWAA